MYDHTPIARYAETNVKITPIIRIHFRYVKSFPSLGIRDKLIILKKRPILRKKRQLISVYKKVENGKRDISVKKEELMICSYCGSEIKKNLKICPQCNTSLE
ncbi:MAG: hypothetical protein HWN81_16920 [Candidatus Lokiarchaeota archaeon]|nr:hypothetical protein [Candidatus Lokiarchaeota archaeon]